MLTKILIGACLLVTSMASHAGLISHNGYERESGSNIVKGGGLEWLKWDETKGMSIGSALDLYSSTGWKLASNKDMAMLFSAFQFGKLSWSHQENLHQFQEMAWSISEQSPHNAFLALFGQTYTVPCSQVSPNKRGCLRGWDPYVFTGALFGSDLNRNGMFNSARIEDDHYCTGHDGTVYACKATAVLSQDEHQIDVGARWGAAQLGVALVRSSVIQPAPVNLPGSLCLLLVGLAILRYRVRLL